MRNAEESGSGTGTSRGPPDQRQAVPQLERQLDKPRADRLAAAYLTRGRFSRFRIRQCQAPGGIIMSVDRLGRISSHSSIAATASPLYEMRLFCLDATDPD
jgi:predicted RNA-binding Zn ribbon-like protein